MAAKCRKQMLLIWQSGLLTKMLTVRAHSVMRRMESADGEVCIPGIGAT